MKDDIYTVWTQVKGEIHRIKCFVNTEMGCNICYDSKYYIADITHGDAYQVDIPDNPTSIGSFHVHVDGEYEFSTTDIRSAIQHKERYIFIGNEVEVYGIDLSKYSKMIRRYGNKWSQLTRRLNTKLLSFDY